MSRSPEKKRERLTGVQRVLLEQLRDFGPQTPNSLLRAKTYEAMAVRGLCRGLDDGSYEITQEGVDSLESKMGRPTKMQGPWLTLVEYYGGPEKFSSAVGCSYVTLNRWSLHGVEPSGPARKMVEKLASEAGLPSPFDRTG